MALARELPKRAGRHTTEIVKLATQSRSLIQRVRAEESFHYDERTKGILHLYRVRREFEEAMCVAKLMCRDGCNREVIDADRVVEMSRQRWTLGAGSGFRVAEMIAEGNGPVVA